MQRNAALVRLRRHATVHRPLGVTRSLDGQGWCPSPISALLSVVTVDEPVGSRLELWPCHRPTGEGVARGRGCDDRTATGIAAAGPGPPGTGCIESSRVGERRS